MENLLQIRPKKNVLFGVTHDLDGNAVLRVPRAVKIGIGLPAGKDVEVYMDYDRTWVIAAPGINEQNMIRYPDRATAQKNWPRVLQAAKDRKYPKKLEYFTFTKPGSVEYDPDFDMIEAHGPRPTEIDVVFVDNSPAHFAFEMWATTELKCHGDGLNGMRVLSMAKTDDEKKLAAEAKAAGMDKFPIVQGCFAKGCEYAKTKCKPVGQLNFQLVANPRLGATAYFHTTSFRSVINLSSNFEQFRIMTGGGDPERGFVAGIPLKFVLRRHKVTLDQGGQKKTSHAYNVALEFRAESAALLRKKMVETGLEYARLAAPPKQLAAPPAPADAAPVDPNVVDVSEEEDFADVVPAAAIAAEFYPDDSTPAEEEFVEGGRSNGPAVETNPAGSTEAAAGLAELKVKWLQQRRPQEFIDFACKRYAELIHSGMAAPEALLTITAEYATNVDPEPQQPEQPKVETIDQSQWLTMMSLAQDAGMKEKDLLAVCRKHGYSGTTTQRLPVSLLKEVIDDLQTPNAAREERPAPEPKKGRFTL